MSAHPIRLLLAVLAFLAVAAPEAADAFSGQKGRWQPVCRPDTAQICNTLNDLPAATAGETASASGGASRGVVYQCKNGDYEVMPLSQVGNCGYWVWTAWSACSAVCGGGVQSRSALCRQPDLPAGNDIVSDAECPQPKPARQTRACNTRACLTEWQTGGWTDCTQTCGGGEQTRSVSCWREGSGRVGDHVCPGTKPATRRACNTQSCAPQPSPSPTPTPSYEWRSDDWSACTVGCGGGVQTRDVWCERDGRHRTSDRLCDSTGPKPVETQPCNTQACALPCTPPDPQAAMNNGSPECRTRGADWTHLGSGRFRLYSGHWWCGAEQMWGQDDDEVVCWSEMLGSCQNGAFRTDFRMCAQEGDGGGGTQAFRYADNRDVWYLCYSHMTDCERYFDETFGIDILDESRHWDRQNTPAR